ncbi:MAG: ABC transporter ATP-binding protein [Clostridia bacterium]
MIKTLIPYTKGYRKSAILAPVFVIFEVALEVMIPLLMSIIVDVGVSGRAYPNNIIGDAIKAIAQFVNVKPGSIGLICLIGGAMIVMAALSLITGALSGKYAAVAANGFAKNLRHEMFKRTQDFSFYNIDKFSTASLVTRLTADVTNTQQSFQMIIRICVRAPIMLIFATTMAITINAELAIVIGFAAPLLAISVILLSRKAFDLFKKMFKHYDDLNLKVQENLISIRTVKAFVRENHETQQFREKSAVLCQASIKAEKLIIWNMPIMQFTMYATLIAVYFLGGKKIVAGEMMDGQLFSFISYITQILMSLMMISMVLVNLVLSKASVARITEVLDEKSDITNDGANENLEIENGDIEFKNVGFSYSKNPKKQVINNINITIKSGETVGIIGGTGSGKTTIVQLIARLYDTTTGDVFVSNHNVKEINIEKLRESVAMVLQNNVLFSGTIKDNLKWGNQNASDLEIENACAVAAAKDFIESFPNGYNTDLGQGGVNVSGGQKQRLCIARALLKRPKILILDDSTSAVDTATDKIIRQGLKQEITDATVIIIAQRINSVIDADKIIVIDDGTINGVGTHKQLLNSNKIYQEVYYSQTNAVGGSK